MSRFKTILVHLANDEGHMTRFEIALELARKFDAHLIALYNLSPVSMPQAGRGYSLGYLKEATEIAREKAVAVKAEVEETCEKAGVPIEWRMDEGDHLKVMSAHAHCADLVIVTHSEADEFEDRITFHIPENVVLTTGCPVLVLPHPCAAKLPGRNVLIAWNNTRQSLRALRDSIPFLQKAEKVILLVIFKAEHEPTPGADIAAALSRHDISPQIIINVNHGSQVGNDILVHAKSTHSDLIVMGAYGQSRLRQIFLGSITKPVTANTTVPVLLSH